MAIPVGKGIVTRTLNQRKKEEEEKINQQKADNYIKGIYANQTGFSSEEIKAGLEQSPRQAQIMSGLSSAVKGLSYGLDSGETGLPQQEEITRQAKSMYPKTAFVGEMVGAFASPITRLLGLGGKAVGAISSKITGKVAPKVLESAMPILSKPIVKAMGTGAVELGAYSGLSETGRQMESGEGYDIGKILTETGKGAGTGAVFGAGLYKATKGVKNLSSKYKKPTTTPVESPMPNIEPSMDIPKRYTVKGELPARTEIPQVRTEVPIKTEMPQITKRYAVGNIKSNPNTFDANIYKVPKSIKAKTDVPLKTEMPQITKRPAIGQIKSNKIMTTTEQNARIKELDNKFKEFKDYKQKDLQRKIIYKDEYNKMVKGEAMKVSAEKRRIIQGDSFIQKEGGLTAKELANKIKREQGFYTGKKVKTPLGDGLATGQSSFGKVGVRLQNGETKYFEKSKVTSQKSVEDIIKKQKELVKENKTFEANIYRIPKNIKAKTEVPKVATPKIETPIIKSERQIEDLSQMTKSQVAEKYGTGKAVSDFKLDDVIEDVGAYVINKQGTKNAKTILESYKKKYSLPEKTKVEYSANIKTNAKAEEIINKNTGEVLGYKIRLKSGMTPEKEIGVLRHEVEHIKDMSQGFKGKEPLPSPRESIGRSAEDVYRGIQQKEAHKNYGWFEPDYLHKAMVKKAIKEGRQVPAQVLKEFPELANTTKAMVPKTLKIIPKSMLKSNVKSKGKVLSTNIKNEVINNANNKTTVKSTGKEKDLRYISNNIPKQNNTPNAVKERVAVSTEIEKKYLQKPNSSVVEEAEKEFLKDPKKAYEGWLQRNTVEGGLRKDVDTVLGQYIQNDLYRKGLVKEADEMVGLMAERALELGRGVQAHNILLKSTPKGYIAHIERQIEKINTAGKEKFGEKWVKVKLDNQIRKNTLNSREITDNMMEDIATNVNSQIDSTFAEKSAAFRRTAMLLNPKTLLRNYLGNHVMSVLRGTSNKIAEGLEIGLEKALKSTGLKDKYFKDSILRTKYTGWEKDLNLKTEVENTFNRFKNSLQQGGRWDVTGRLGIEQTGFRQTFKNELLNKADKLTQDLLQKGDFKFLKNSFESSLGQYMKTRGLNKATAEAIDYATEKAYQATFRDNTLFSNIIGNIKRHGGVIGKAFEIGIPFVKTPGAILSRGIEYSPINMLNMVSKTITKGYKGNPAAFIDDFSKMLTGTGVIGFGYYMANSGLAKIGFTEKGKGYAITQEAGEQKYSINTPYGSFTFDWAQPVAIPFAMGVAISEAIEKYGSPEKGLAAFKIMSKALDDGFGTIENMSVLKFITNLFSGQKSLTETALDIPSNYIQQNIPTLIGQVSKTIDPNKRDTYDPNYFKRSLNTIVAKTPLSSTLPKKLDVFGNPQMQSGDNVVTRAIMQFGMPSYFAKKTDDKLVQELTMLYSKGSETEFLPRIAPRRIDTKEGTKYLSQDEINNFQTEMGKKVYLNMNKFMSNPIYNTLSEEEKKSQFTTIAKQSYDSVKEEYTGTKTKGDKRLDRIKRKKQETIKKKGIRAGYITE